MSIESDPNIIGQRTESQRDNILLEINKLLSEYKKRRPNNESEIEKALERLMQVLEVELDSINSKENVLPDKQPNLHELLQAINFYNAGTEEGEATAFDIIEKLIETIAGFSTSD